MIQVMIGAMIGSIVRVYLSRFNGKYPIATLSINSIGSLLLGMLSGVDSYYLLFGMGMMGGLTTFSTFTVETINLFMDDKKTGLIYVILSVALPLSLFLLGYSLLIL